MLAMLSGNRDARHLSTAESAVYSQTLEGISQMPKENHRASEVQKAGEIGGVPLIPGDESPRVLQPGKEAFDFPAAFIAT